MRCRGEGLVEAQGRMSQVRHWPGASGWRGTRGESRSQGGRGRCRAARKREQSWRRATLCNTPVQINSGPRWPTCQRGSPLLSRAPSPTQPSSSGFALLGDLTGCIDKWLWCEVDRTGMLLSPERAGPRTSPCLLQERQMTETFPHLLNVNEDPQLTGVLKYFIQAGTHPS